MYTAPEFIGSSNSPNAPSACPLCDSPRLSRSRLSTEPFPLLECAACGITFLFPQPEEAELASYYDESYYGKGRKKFLKPVEMFVEAFSKRKWKKIEPLLEKNGRLLDIGCGRATLVKLARVAGHEAYGIERTSLPDESLPYVFYKDLHDCQFPDAHFQVVILWHVLEHLRDPADTVREIQRILKPGGWVSIAVPNYGGAQSRASGRHWFHLDLPRHLWHFRRSTLETLLARFGFRIVRCSTFSFEYDWFGTLQSWMNRALKNDNRFYSLLKGERPFPLHEKIFCLVAASLLSLPALGSALWDAARGEGGTLEIIMQK